MMIYIYLTLNEDFELIQNEILSESWWKLYNIL